jgi:hypothetical protein
MRRWRLKTVPDLAHDVAGPPNLNADPIHDPIRERIRRETDTFGEK